MIHAFSAAWREVKPFLVGLGAVLLLMLWLPLPFRWAALLPAVLMGWIIFFFRDPDRRPADFSSAVILSAADGRVTAIEQVFEPLFFQGPAWRISVFLSLFNVHVQRSPYQGIVQFQHYHKGAFAPAYLKDTHLNEFNLVAIQTPNGSIAVKQIAGILARRIVSWPSTGDSLAAGQRYGLIKFGSRVDLYLPLEVNVLVQVGQQVRGGETIMAKWAFPAPSGQEPSSLPL
jgi:phosphatidylserine decarboxylase